MPIDPYILDCLPLITGLGSHEEIDRDPRQSARYEAFCQDPAPYEIPELVIEDRAIDGPRGSIPVRIYRRLEDSDSRRPALMWMHGGGFRSGELDWAEAHVVSAEIAHRADAVVVSVDYRLAVAGVRYPVPLDDVMAAWNWLLDACRELGCDPDQLSIGGASAGSNLAFAACTRLRDEGGALPAATLLAYPVVHFPVPALADDVQQQMQVLPDFLRFFAETNEQMYGNYVGRTTNLPGYVTPGQLDLSGLPPAHIIISEYDDLRPSGELLARQLQESGVAVSTYLASGMLHGHLNRTPALAEVDRSLDFFARAVHDSS